MWPTHQNGKPKMFGELNGLEKRAVMQRAISKLKAEFESPEFRAALLAAGETINHPKGS